MKASFWLAGAAGMASALTACAPDKAAAPPAETASPSLIVRGDRLFVPARINGSPTEAALDSGAEMSFLDTGLAREIGLVTAGTETARGTGGEEEVTFAEGVTIEAAGVVLENRTVAVLDLSDISARLIGAPITMVVGRDLFDAARFEIDMEKGRIAAVAQGAEPAGVRLAMETDKGIQTIPVSVEGGEAVQAAFDLGNGNEVLIGGEYADRAGLSSPERIVGRKAGGGVGGEVVLDLVVLKELEIAGVTFRDVPAAIDRTETAADVNVGVRTLRNFKMTVDFAENAVWLEPR